MNDFGKIRIQTTKDPRFPELWEMYQESFPACEKRSLEQQDEVLKKDIYHLDAWLKDEKVVGLAGWWRYSEFAFIEHFAVHSSVRSFGYGSRLFRDLISAITTPVILEIEPMSDETAHRRFRFYERFSFVLNPFEHYQPPYRPDMKPVSLLILSYPTVLSEILYQLFAERQKKEIMPQF